MFINKNVFKDFAIFTGKQLCWSLYLKKLKPFRPASLLKRDFNIGVFQCILPIFIYVEKHLRTAASDYSFTLVIHLFSTVSLYNYKGKPWSFMVKKMFIEIRLCNPMTYLKEHDEIVEIYMVKFNVSILNRHKIMAFFVNAKCLHKHDVILLKERSDVFLK